MKKLFTLIIIFCAAFSLRGNAQCNPAFNFQFLSLTSVKFTPAITTDSPLVQHYWLFGDNTASTAISPIHTYVPGVYNVKHYVIRTNPNGVELCRDSAVRVITVLQQCNLTSNYSSAPAPNNPLEIHFLNTSLGFEPGDSIIWTFGDGTFSYEVNPTHVYADTGTYSVCLWVKKNANTPSTNQCFSSMCHGVWVTGPTANTCNLQVYFSSTADTLHPNIIHFTNQSIGYNPGDSITWTFGDGNISHDLNPVHTYANSGSYYVCLLIRKPNTSAGTPCVREYCKMVVITEPCTLTANFSWYRDSTALSIYTYHFNNLSAPINTTDSIRWTFGDGTFSNQANPNHAYAQPGTYNVCLRVQKRNNAGALTNCVSEVCHTVTITQICNILPAFTWRADSVSPKKIYFTNTTTTPATNAVFTWSFGDGASLVSWNAVHEYAQPGRYYVCLKMQYGSCVTYKCDSITVSASPIVSCTQLSNFHAVQSTSAGVFSFVPNNIISGVQYTWTFGDGTGMQGPTATHQYANPGVYTVCLTAYRTNSCASTSCTSVQVPAPVNCNVTIGFNDIRDSLVPNRITFIALPTSGITDQVWTITRVPTTATTGTATIHQNNPTYVFPDSGYYNVCLRATLTNGCIREYCRVIHIAYPMPTGSNACSMQIFPNPATSNITAVLTLTQPQMIYAYVYNSMNMLLIQKQQQGVVGNNTLPINISALPAGVYSLKIIHGNDICNATFIKQ